MKTSRSPVVTNSDFHIASPLPGWVPRSGRISAERCTTAPASVATAYVASVESLSITTISSSSATVSTSASRTRVTTSPTVAASLRAGTTRLTRVAGGGGLLGGQQGLERPVVPVPGRHLLPGASLVSHAVSLRVPPAAAERACY